MQGECLIKKRYSERTTTHQLTHPILRGNSTMSLEAFAKKMPMGKTMTREVAAVIENSVGEAVRLTKATLNAPEQHKIHGFLINLLKCTTLPEFIDEPETIHDSNDNPNIDWAAIPWDDFTTPLRMFDVDTGNMVDTSQLTPSDQYCMLSHSWKGTEIDYKYFSKATKEHDGWKSNDENIGLNDVSLLEEKCQKDLEDILSKLNQSGDEDVYERLQLHMETKKIQEDVVWARRKEEKANRDMENARQQRDHAIGILSTEKNKRRREEFKGSLADWATAAENEWKKAKSNLEGKQELCEEKKEQIKAANEDRRTFYELDILLQCLQRKKSLHKIQEAIIQTKQLFDGRHFPPSGKRYVWLDTCCIDKTDSGELTKSLALMGEWYANADFCLVHLDTDPSDDEWLEVFKAHEKKDTIPGKVANVQFFDDIKLADVKWAKRGWTLQELVLSKMTFYVNSDWQMLDRPIDQLGPYYSLALFLDNYLKNIASERDLSDLLESSWNEFFETGDADRQPSTQNKFNKLATLLQAIKLTVPKLLSIQTAEAQIGWAVKNCASQVDSVWETENDIAHLCRGLDPLDYPNRCIVIQFLLRQLRKITIPLIHKDLKTISKFGKITTLKDWSLGTTSTGFSAYSVLTTSSSRETTIATDKAYSLMGILGVKFPAFPAEGLPKALSRLLDEVIITSNDVSVFNWSGKYYGSTIQGRSLYPSRIEAYKDHADFINGAPDINKQLLGILNAAREEKMRISREVNDLLMNMIKVIGPLDYDELSEDVDNTFKSFIQHLKIKPLAESWPSVSRLRELKQQFCDLSRIKEKKESTQDPVPNEEEKEKEPTNDQSNFGFGMSFGKVSRMDIYSPIKISTPKFGLSWTSQETPKMANPTPVQEPSPFEKRVQSLKEAMEKFQESSQDSYDKNEEENEKQSASCQSKCRKSSDQPKEDTRTKCNNPIVVSSSGINGIFDIQRVVVRMRDVEKLYSRIKKAVSGQNVEGWCTISTGFAYTLVNFNCERDMVKQQLDMADVNEKIMLIDPDAKLGTMDSQPTNKARPEAEAEPDAKRETMDSQPTNKAGSQAEVEPNAEQAGYGKKEKTSAQKRLARMIDMVQETDLRAVAGEWVLARISDVPTANWFLCRLELGAGSELYARRIPTEAFTFASAIPEPGLTDYWDQFMADKKAIACDSLLKYLQGKRYRRAGAHLMDNARTDQEGIPIDPFAAFIDQAVKGVALLTDIGFEFMADHLQKHLVDSAMNNIPPKLQAAVQDLDAQKSLFPVMFSSGVHLHMF